MQKKNCLMLVADKNSVNPTDMEGFSHFAHEENVAIGYKVAKLLNLPRDRALKAMQSAVADPGAFNIEYIKFNSYTLAWANLFAVNDRESFIEVCLKLFKQLPSYKKVVLLNNRHDRPTRVELFAGMARDLQFDRVITLGAYESVVNQVFSIASGRVVNLGDSTKFKNTSATELLNEIVAGIKENKVLLIGAVNIHTEQAEKLLHFFEEELRLEKASKEEPSKLYPKKAEKANV